MNKELEDKLFQDFPVLYSQERENSCAKFTFDCLDGWHALIREFSEKMTPLMTQARQEGDPDGFFARIVGIKEKFGGLRVYLSTGTDAMYDLINEYEDRSEHICEICGEPGTIDPAAFYKAALCEDHKER